MLMVVCIFHYLLTYIVTVSSLVTHPFGRYFGNSMTDRASIFFVINGFRGQNPLESTWNFRVARNTFDFMADKGAIGAAYRKWSQHTSGNEVRSRG
jgi:hypothetical protein